MYSIPHKLAIIRLVQDDLSAAWTRLESGLAPPMSLMVEMTVSTLLLSSRATRASTLS